MADNLSTVVDNDDTVPELVAMDSSDLDDISGLVFFSFSLRRHELHVRVGRSIWSYRLWIER